MGKERLLLRLPRLDRTDWCHISNFPVRQVRATAICHNFSVERIKTKRTHENARFTTKKEEDAIASILGAHGIPSRREGQHINRDKAMHRSRAEKELLD